MEVTISLEALRPLGWTALNAGIATGIALLVDRRRARRIEAERQTALQNLNRIWGQQVEAALQALDSRQQQRMIQLDRGLAANIELIGELQQRQQIVEARQQGVMEQVAVNTEQVNALLERSESTRNEMGGLNQALELLRNQAPLQEEFRRRRSAGEGFASWQPGTRAERPAGNEMPAPAGGS
jgi:hypothetical protein